MPLPLTPFYMIRHGETEANRDRIIAGSTDSPLTDKGRAQAEQASTVVEKLSIKPTRIYHSNLSRARDTAHAINTKLSLETIEEPHFAEWHFGSWEGMAFDDYFGDKKDFKPNDWPEPPGDGESEHQFVTRIKTAKQKTISDNPPALIVSHGGVFRAFGLMYGHIGALIENCVLYEFQPAPEKSLPWTIYRHDIGERTPVQLFQPMDTPPEIAV